MVFSYGLLSKNLLISPRREKYCAEVKPSDESFSCVGVATKMKGMMNYKAGPKGALCGTSAAREEVRRWLPRLPDCWMLKPVVPSAAVNVLSLFRKVVQ